MRVDFRGNPCQLEILEHHLTCLPNGNVSPKQNGCCASRRTSSLELAFDDIIGAERVGTNGVKVHFTKLCGKPTKTRRALHQAPTMICEGAEAALEAVAQIQNFARGGRDASSKNELFALLNPASGPGKASLIFENDVRTLLEDVCGFTVKSETSAKQGDITEAVKRADLANCCGILYFGGDGTVHEGLQGLFSRADWEVSSQLPFAQFPVGSGNALAASTGLWDVPTAVHAVCKGRFEPIDIMSIVQSGRRYFSFLGMMYGSMTTLDIGTESLRWMGEARFSVGAIREIAKLSSYALKMAYLSETEEPANAHPESADNAPHESASLTGNSKGLSETDQSGQEFTALSLSEKCSDVLPDGGPSMAVVEWFGKAKEGDKGPDGWCMVDSFNVRLSTVLNLPYIALSTKFIPLSKASDGAMYIVAIPSGTSNSRLEMTNVFLKVDSGDHIQSKAVDVKKVKAVMLAPAIHEKAKTWLTVDGEIIPIQPAYIEMHPQACQVFTA